MPEGDTLYRTAVTLRGALVGRTLTAAGGRAGPAAIRRLAGREVLDVRSVGKHLLVDVGGGLTLHTHLGMHGAWTCYRPGRPRGRHGGREVAVLATEDWIAACFDAPTVEVVETRALRLHPVLASLGPDLLAPEPDLARALALLRAPERADRMIGDALLDQSAVAGLGNVYRSEVCFLERIDPFARVADLPEPTLRRLLEASARLLAANRAGRARSTTGCTAPGERLWVYRRAGRPCRRCGSLIRSRASGALGRRTYWCPACQPPVRAPAPTMPEMGAG